jgi:hypothetical protein
MATKPIPVRIPEDWLPRIDAVAARLGTNRARLIAFLAQTFAEEFARKGMAMLPPNWEEVLASLDGRRRKIADEDASGAVNFDNSSGAGDSKKDSEAHVWDSLTKSVKPSIRRVRRKGRP